MYRVIKKLKNPLLCVFMFTFIFSFADFTEAAVAPYASYNYNVWGESVPVPATYEVTDVLNGNMLGSGPFRSPGDLTTDSEGNFYVLDSGNGRIVAFDSDWKLKSEIIIGGDESAYEGTIDLSTASGLNVRPDGTVWIALGASGGLIHINSDGSKAHVLSAPTGRNAPSNLVFKPLKVEVGRDGTLYVVSEGTYQGIIEMTQEGTFLGYFGSNRVDVTLKVITEFFWKRFFSIFSDTALDSMIKIVPIEYSSISTNPKGFIYAVTANSANSMYEIKKLDPKGKNVIRIKPGLAVPPGVRLNIGDYGDIEQNYDQGTLVDTRFIDVSANESGFIFALDSQRGRVFQYDQESNLIAIFGGTGNQLGTFADPVAVQASKDNGNVYVLDRKSGDITVFKLTDFGQTIIDATVLFNNGLYSDAEDKWQAVLRQSSNFDLAYVGLGKALFNRREYTESMKNFRLGYDKKGYDEAFTEFRKDLMRDNLPVIGIALLAAILLYFVVRRLMPAKSWTAYTVTAGSKWLPVRYVLFHPFKAFNDVRSEGCGDMRISGVLLASYVLVHILTIGLTGFLFNNNRLETIDIGREGIIIIGLFVIWIIANWAVSTLTDGEGRTRDIIIISGYALMPLIISDILTIVLSQVLTMREGAFLEFFATAAMIWAALILFIGVMAVHHYSAAKTLFSIVLSFVGIVFVLFLGALVYSLFRQMMVFISNIFTEIMFRI